MAITIEKKFSVFIWQHFDAALQGFPLHLQKFRPCILNLGNAGQRMIAQAISALSPPLTNKCLRDIEGNGAGPFREVRPLLKVVIAFPEDDTNFLNDVICIGPVPDDCESGCVDIVVSSGELAQKDRFSSLVKIPPKEIHIVMAAEHLDL
jgi:hypothetical protein